MISRWTSSFSPIQIHNLSQWVPRSVAQTKEITRISKWSYPVTGISLGTQTTRLFWELSLWWSLQKNDYTNLKYHTRPKVVSPCWTLTITWCCCLCTCSGRQLTQAFLFGRFSNDCKHKGKERVALRGLKQSAWVVGRLTGNDSHSILIVVEKKKQHCSTKCLSIGISFTDRRVLFRAS